MFLTLLHPQPRSSRQTGWVIYLTILLAWLPLLVLAQRGLTGTTVAGGNGQGAAANQFYFASGVFVDGSGNIFVADQFNHRIQKFPPGSTSATNGVTVAGGNGPGSAPNQLNFPRGLFVTADGTLFVSEIGNDRIQKFPPGSTSATNGVTVAGGNGRGSQPTNSTHQPGLPWTHQAISSLRT